MGEKQQALYNKTKNDVVSVVVSSKYPVLVRDIRREYEELTGQRLPFAELGFRSPEELYRSMTDVVRIEPNSYTGDVLRSVDRPQTEHLIKLVKEQNASKSKRGRTYNRPGSYQRAVANNYVPRAPPGFQNRHTLLPTPATPYQQQYIQQGVVNRQQPNPGSFVANRQQPQPELRVPMGQAPNPGSFVANRQQPQPEPRVSMAPQPNIQSGPCAATRQQPSFQSCAATGQQSQPISDDFKKYLGEIIEGHPDGLTFTKLQQIFRLKCGQHWNPLIMGYTKWEDFIAAIPDVARLQKTGMGMIIFPVKNSTNHVINNAKVLPIKEQPKSVVQPEVATTSNHVVSKTISENKEYTSQSGYNDKALSVISEESSKYESDKFEHDLSSERSQYDAESDHDVHSQHYAHSEVASLSDDVEYLYRETSDEEEYQATESGMCYKINPKIKLDLLKIIKLHPDGLPNYDLLEEYEKFTGHQLNLRDYGFTSVDELVYSARDVIQTVYINGDAILCSKANPLIKRPDTQAEAKIKPQKTEPPPVTSDVLKKMLEVFVDVAGGVSLNEFPDLYRLIHREKFEMDDTACISLEALFLKLRNFFELKDSVTGDVSVNYTSYGRDLLKSLSTPTLNSQRKELPKSAPPLKVPDDAVKSFEAGPHFSKREDFKVGCRYKVEVCCVFRPDKFWIQLNENAQSLDELLDVMAATYDDPSMSEKYAIHPSMVKCNLPCVVYFRGLNEWNRGLVTSVEGGNVEVKLYDYGNSLEVHVTELKYLRKAFAELPVSCWRAKLANIEGTFQGKWTEESKNRFWRLTLNHSFTARIVDNVAALSIELLDQNVNIGELLCSQGYANHIQRTDLDQNSRGFRIISDDVRNSVSPSMEVHQSQRKDQTLTSTQRISRCTDKMNQLSIAAERSDYNSKVKKSQVYNSDDSLRKLSSAQQSRPLKTPDCSALVSNQSKNVSLKGSPGCSFRIVPVKILTDNDLHVVRLSGVCYMPTFEISRFFWGADMLKQFTNTLQPDVEYVTIQPSDRYGLFEELLTVCDDPPTTHIDLIPTKVLPIVLPKILKRDQDIVQEIASVADMFT